MICPHFHRMWLGFAMILLEKNLKSSPQWNPKWNPKISIFGWVPTNWLRQEGAEVGALMAQNDEMLARPRIRSGWHPLSIEQWWFTRKFTICSCKNGVESGNEIKLWKHMLHMLWPWNNGDFTWLLSATLRRFSETCGDSDQTSRLGRWLF